MLRLAHFLVERAPLPNKALAGSLSDILGKIHEHLVGRELNGGKFMSPDSEREHNELKKSLSAHGPTRYQEEVDKAKTTAAAIKQHHPDIRAVHHVSKAGDIERVTGKKTSQTEDPSDLMLEKKDGSFHGISLKSGAKASSSPGLHNEGRSKIDKRLGVNTDKHVKSIHGKLITKHPELGNKSVSEVKAAIKTNPKIKQSFDTIRKPALEKIRNEYHSAYSAMNTREVSQHLIHITHSIPTSIPHTRVTTVGVGSSASTVLANPAEKNKEFYTDHKNIVVSKSGSNSIMFHHVHPKTGKKTLLARERLKFASGSDSAATVKSSVSEK